MKRTGVWLERSAGERVVNRETCDLQAGGVGPDNAPGSCLATGFFGLRVALT